jgi:hypothetical protein
LRFGSLLPVEEFRSPVVPLAVTLVEDLPPLRSRRIGRFQLLGDDALQVVLLDKSKETPTLSDGWGAADLFGCDPEKPFQCVDRAWFLRRQDAGLNPIPPDVKQLTFRRASRISPAFVPTSLS